jgi:hypothetical protein
MTDHRIVFVGGLHRSGTTALTRCLAAHPQISGFQNTGVKEDEGQHLQSIYPSARTYGGAGRFALHPAAHLTESSPLLKPETGMRLFELWRRHWDLDRPILIEKSPPNLIMTRFLQGAFADARFIMVVRHPAVVTLATRKWALQVPVEALLNHWFVAHRLLEDDAPFLQHLLVVKYECLVAAPQRTLAGIAKFIGVDGDIPADGIDNGRGAPYERQWSDFAQNGLSRGQDFRELCHRYERAADHFGYSLLDVNRAEPLRFDSLDLRDDAKRPPSDSHSRRKIPYSAGWIHEYDGGPG